MSAAVRRTTRRRRAPRRTVRVARVRLGDRLDTQTARTVERHCMRAMAGATAGLAVDLSQVVWLDSAGLGVLIRLIWAARRAHKTFHASGACGGAAALLDQVGLTPLLAPRDAAEAAHAS